MVLSTFLPTFRISQAATFKSLSYLQTLVLVEMYDVDIAGPCMWASKVKQSRGVTVVRGANSVICSGEQVLKSGRPLSEHDACHLGNFAGGCLLRLSLPQRLTHTADIYTLWPTLRVTYLHALILCMLKNKDLGQYAIMLLYIVSYSS